jgi:hypothetical protein
MHAIAIEFIICEARITFQRQSIICSRVEATKTVIYPSNEFVVVSASIWFTLLFFQALASIAPASNVVLLLEFFA